MLLVDADSLRVFSAEADDDDRGYGGAVTFDPVVLALSGGVNTIQWRDFIVASMFEEYKPVEAFQLFRVELTSWFVPISNEFQAVHLPEAASTKEELASATAKLRQRIDGDEVLISRSVHSLEAAVQAEIDGADMLVLGTVFQSSSHPGGPTIGLDGVRAVCDAVSVPVIGIGGITAANAGDVIRAGASGVAVISAIFDADDPRAAAAELRAAIDAAWAERHPVP